MCGATVGAASKQGATLNDMQELAPHDVHDTVLSPIGCEVPLDFQHTQLRAKHSMQANNTSHSQSECLTSCLLALLVSRLTCLTLPSTRTEASTPRSTACDLPL